MCKMVFGNNGHEFFIRTLDLLLEISFSEGEVHSDGSRVVVKGRRAVYGFGSRDVAVNLCLVSIVLSPVEKGIMDPSIKHNEIY